ncbi:MAG: CRISPR-associated protein Cas4 [Candidatus Faecousia sp.]|nr:CRISPR-associated protein Cas4 [Candidatus Faecousia sp.]
MIYSEEDFLQLSGLQHFAFCRRQWALIHIEHQWAENYRTVDGTLMHEKAHDRELVESRGDVLIQRGVSVYAPELGVSGQCDVLEYHRGSTGIPIAGKEGLWQPYPVEYKRGSPKETDADVLQLCGQAMCLETMLCCDVPEGALYYGEIRRRERVSFTPELRSQVKDLLTQMHDLYQRGYTPKVKPTKSCNACSLKEVCLPKLMKNRSVSAYLKAAMEEVP